MLNQTVTHFFPRPMVTTSRAAATAAPMPNRAAAPPLPDLPTRSTLRTGSMTRSAQQPLPLDADEAQAALLTVALDRVYAVLGGGR